MPGDTRDAYAVIGASGNESCDARAVPRAATRLAVFEPGQGEIGLVDPITWVGRVGIASIAVVGADEARARLPRDKIEARQQLAAFARVQQIRMIEAHTCVEHGYDCAAAALRNVPGRIGSQGGHLRAVQVPLVCNEWVVG